MRSVGGVGVVLLLLLGPGCATVPPLQENGIAIAEIVQRVKCEIAYAIPKPEPPYPGGRFQWMRNWTAKVDLTLATNAKSAVTPTAVITKLFPSVPVAGVGNVSRNFTLGLAAGIDTSADRTEILSFTVSLAEMLKFKEHGHCALPDELYLYGHLGLREWIDSALAPVASRQLRVGRHPPPGGKSPPPPVVVPRILTAAPDVLAELRQAKDAVEHYAVKAEISLANAWQNGGRDDIQATYDDASLIYGAQNEAVPEFKKAQALAMELSKSHPQHKAEIEQLLGAAKKAFDRIDTAKKTVNTIIEGLPRDPPIDSLSHSVKFVVAVSGSVSPNWLLVNFRGPTASGTLASGSFSRTHTLSIAMGHPGALPNEQARQLNNLVIIQTLGQSAPAP